MTKDKILEMYKVCLNGEHRFTELCREGNDFEEMVVRWCRVCGSSVIDVEYDGRLEPGEFMKLKSPLITQLIDLKELKSD